MFRTLSLAQPASPLPEGLVPVPPAVVPVSVPLYGNRVPAGFPSPADDHVEGRLDPTSLLVKRPAATFFCRADGDSMVGAGIHDGDLLVVDRSIPPQPGDVVVATLDGGLTVKRLGKGREGWELVPAHPDYPSFRIDPEQGVQIWGVVTHSVTTHCDR